MLKSTYRQAAETPQESPLPPGWTEHKAPTGHSYYYHAESKQSTYTRPAIPSDEPLQIDYGATEPDHVMRASLQVMDEFHKNNANMAGPGHFTGGKSYQDPPRRRGNQGDRPKSKAAIPNCGPWVLVKTKMDRRFVHNTETKQSLWKFPQDVMMAVIEMDRLEWEAKKKAENQPQESQEPESTQTGDAPTKPSSTDQQRPAARQDEYDSDSYEEVEVTDDEAEEEEGAHGSSKRHRLSHGDGTPPSAGPVEFDEDDIAFQLAEMEGNYDEDGDDEDYANADEEDEGLPLTAGDQQALFRSLLDDSNISPYSTFEKLIEDTWIVEDPRYVALPNTATRKDAFASWSKDRISELQAVKKSEQARQKARDPRVEYLRFLHRNATPKLYWPEFKRKFKREAEMRDVAMPDKDREKLYRELVSKLKSSEGERRKELVALLKSVDKAALHQTGAETEMELPDAVLRDARFYTIEEGTRDELVQTFLATW